MLVLGHRGDLTRHPQNTLAGFEAALSLGADGVEFDVRRTLDRKLVIHHDPGPEQLTLSELRLREPLVPTLAETLDLLKGRCLMNIELKTTMGINEVAKEVIGSCEPEEIVFSSFSAAALALIADAAPMMRRGLLVGAKPHATLPGRDILPWGRLRRANARLLVVEHRFLAQIVPRAINRGVDVWSWNWYGELCGSKRQVSTPEQINVGLAYGLEAVIVDRPPTPCYRAAGES